MSANTVINVRAESPDFSPLNAANPNVQKIIIGESPTNSSAVITPVADLPLFEADFRKLTHLFLWSTSGLVRVPALAPKQQVLEIRQSADLSEIDTLPVSLCSLVLENCPNLATLPSLQGKKYGHLVELSLAGCPKVDPDWINQLITAAPKLKRIDLSRCSQITKLPTELPHELDRLDLNEGTGLLNLPDPLPLSLRRLGLRGASALRRVPELQSNIDYVDLVQTESLIKLPKFPRLEKAANGALVAVRPRTLFLHGSGIMEPPASEHGATADTNVALETREYQDEVDLVGRGTVRRCKLLLLGNGSAGKTMLALNLNPHFNKAAKEIGGDYAGTTHGVQFWDWPDYDAEENQEHASRKVSLHTWDFGGQEIYHSTHRLFVSRGSVFVILWNPDQDGQQPPLKDGYQDTWFPVRYWLDYIHMECPHKSPLVAIVCSHRGQQCQTGNQPANQKLKQQLQAKLRQDIREYADRIPLFVLDSEHDIGERQELESWLQQSVYTVVETQGTVVPTYWEIAQNMVEEWLPDPRRPSDDIENAADAVMDQDRRLQIPEFIRRLHAAITTQLNSPDNRTNSGRGSETDFTSLRQNYAGGDFLTERRVLRTLRFLTHSGWLYWNPALEKQVIINQPWALNLIYLTLDRRPESAIFKKLTASNGEFTFENLRDWYWRGAALDQDDQQLILSFMTSIGVCFELEHRYTSEATRYISPTHLPDSAELIAEFDSAHPDQTNDKEIVESRLLHRGHWFAILRELCKRYGKEGTYTKTACLIEGSTYRWNREDKPWQALLQFQLDDEKKGLGGKIFIRVAGVAVAEKLPAMKRFVESFLPGFEGKASDAIHEFDIKYRGCIEGAPTVFFSYARDPKDQDVRYEVAVNAVFDALKPLADRGLVKLLRDTVSIGSNDYITEFVAKAGSQDVDLVLVFTSERYWKSWWCMLEFSSLMSSLIKSNRGIDKSVLVIEHETGKKWTAGDVAQIVDHWENLELVKIKRIQYPKNLPEQLLKYNWQLLVDEFIQNVVMSSTPLTSDAPGLRREWKPENADEIIAWVKQKLRLPIDGDKP